MVMSTVKFVMKEKMARYWSILEERLYTGLLVNVIGKETAKETER